MCVLVTETHWVLCPHSCGTGEWFHVWAWLRLTSIPHLYLSKQDSWVLAEDIATQLTSPFPEAARRVCPHGKDTGFPGAASGKEPTCQCKRHKKCRFNPWVGKILWRRAWQPTPVFLPGESHGQRSQRAGHDWATKSHCVVAFVSNSTFLLIFYLPTLTCIHCCT